MKPQQVSFIFSLVSLSLLFSVSLASQNVKFFQCFQSLIAAPTSNISTIIYTPTNTAYSTLLQSSIQNLRFNSSTTSKPNLIITPLSEYDVKSTIICARRHKFEIRVRSGGHDYEGLSYISDKPFVLIDLVNFREVDVNVNDKTAWVQAGANLGEVYYSIANKSNVLAFPAGVCPTIGVGGHISGGGQGTLIRKYGLAADNVLDARIVTAKGKILNRKSMGESLFWAIRGGGGASFGVILSWKIKLVDVPPVVTVFTARRTLEQGATKLVHRWQEIADKFPEDLFVRLLIMRADNNQGGKTIQVLCNSLFLGTTKQLLTLMNGMSFPELGLKAEECMEMSWIQSILYFAQSPKGAPIDVLLNRTHSRSSFKAKSDFVKTPVPEIGLEGLWKKFLQNNTGMMILDPYGARMSNISSSETPFPHRDGTLYNIQYYISWSNPNATKASRKWVSDVYNYMTPFVSSSPRSSYLNYKDLDLGRCNIPNFLILDINMFVCNFPCYRNYLHLR